MDEMKKNPGRAAGDETPSVIDLTEAALAKIGFAGTEPWADIQRDLARVLTRMFLSKNTPPNVGRAAMPLVREAFDWASLMEAGEDPGDE